MPASRRLNNEDATLKAAHTVAGAQRSLDIGPVRFVDPLQPGRPTLATSQRPGTALQVAPSRLSGAVDTMPNPMRRPLLAGNWKMNLGVAESVRLAAELRAKLGSTPDRDVALFPAFISVAAVAAALSDSSIQIGGQDCAAQTDGAFTGAVSATMLRSTGARMVILGHSERRHVFGEADSVVAEKLTRALAAGLTPVLCVGETRAERDAGQTAAVVLRQLNSALDVVSRDALPQFVIAYEPVWAIGTGLTATPAQAQEVHALLRAALRERAGAVAEDLRILYGGSVKGSNIDTLMQQPDIDGALVGGAALQAEEFARIVAFRGA